MGTLARIQRLRSVGRLNYSAMFLSEYAAFAVWYRSLGGATDDKTALAKVKQTLFDWNSYYEDEGVRRTINSLSSSRVKTEKDWSALIDVWYEVRCQLIHGEEVDVGLVEAAFCTLSRYIDRVEDMLSKQFTKYDTRRLYELTILLDQSSIKYNTMWGAEKTRLYQKYLRSSQEIIFSHDKA